MQRLCCSAATTLRFRATLGRVPAAALTLPAWRTGASAAAAGDALNVDAIPADVRAHLESVREEFNRQCDRYDAKWNERNLDKEKIKAWTLRHLPLCGSMHVLDLACGTGLLSRAMAPHVATATGLDATPGMLEQARALAKAEGLENTVWRLGEGETLPFPDSTFDMATCRLAIHHFLRPELQVAEMVRVTRRGGHVAIIDIVSPADPAVAARYNELETLRDPTHTRALALSELRSHVSAAAPSATFAATSLEDTPTLVAPVRLEAWMDLTQTPHEKRRKVVQAVESELNGGLETGLQPWRDENGDLRFQQRWAIVVAGV